MSALEVLDYPEAIQVAPSATQNLYNLNRLIELCPDAMNVQECFDTKRPKKSSVDSSLNRRHSDDAHSAELSISALSQDTQSYIENVVQQRSQSHYRQAHFDALTHLPNRAHFLHKLHDTILDTEQVAFALLFLDLDGFKAVNDNCSHQVGDELLQLVSARLQSAVREEDFISRLGGDEFCIIVPETNIENLKVVCERIICEVSRSYWIDSQDVRISTSIGVALYPNDAKFANDLINFADQALYHSKDLGKKQAFFYYQLPASVNEDQNPTEKMDLTAFEITSQVWKNADSSLLEIRANHSDKEDALSALSKADNIPTQVISQWLWDSAQFHLDLLPAGKEDQVVLRLNADLLNDSEFLPNSWSNASEDLAILLSQSEWEKLSPQSHQKLNQLKQMGLALVCELETPWAIDWSMIEQFGVQGFVMSEDVMQAFEKQPTSIQTLFNMAVESFALKVWYPGG